MPHGYHFLLNHDVLICEICIYHTTFW